MPESKLPTSDTLADFRDEIDRIDRQIVALLESRQKVVDQIVAHKKAHGLPVYHPAREENLISEKRHLGAAAGMDPDFIEELFRAIIRQSRKSQSRRMARRAIRPDATVLVVGGTGAMGGYFASLFSEAGYQVNTMGSRDWDQAPQWCQNVDLVILSVPIDRTEAVAHRLGPMLPPSCLLVDFTSIKSRPVAAMMAAHNGPVMGLHPLFGPTTSNLDKQIVVATDGRHPEECQWLVDQLAGWGAIVVRSSPTEHDDIMGIVQALRHFATFAFGQFLHQKGVNLGRTLEFSSPIYRLELGMVGRLFAQDPSLYSEIIFASEDRRQLLQEYLASLQANIKLLETADKTAFEERFRQIAEWFDPFSQQAMRESTYLIERLIERF